jgi:hypothetical protein
MLCCSFNLACLEKKKIAAAASDLIGRTTTFGSALLFFS